MHTKEPAHLHVHRQIQTHSSTKATSKSEFLLILPVCNTLRSSPQRPTPHLASSRRTKAPPLSPFPHILRQGRRALCGRAFEALSAHSQPAWKCGFTTAQRKGPGLVIDPNASSRETTIPKHTEQLGFSGYPYRKRVRGGKSFLISYRNSTNI